MEAVGLGPSEDSIVPLRPSTSRPSLFRSHATVPCLVRYGLPLLFLGNIGLLLYSNLTLGASVHARVYDGKGNDVELPVLYNVSLAGSIDDMWRGEAYFMSTLIAVCSGAWPHFKLVISLLCWFLDEGHLPPKLRARVLILTYALQKFSHVETMTLVILMTAFSFTARLPNHEDWGVWAYVTPQPGFYAFLGGLIISMVLSRVALYYDHVSRASAAAATARTRGPSYLMLAESDGEAAMAGAVDNEEESNAPSLSWASSSSVGKLLGDEYEEDDADRGPAAWWEVFKTYSMLGLVVCFGLGLILPAFTFHFQGLAGWILDNVTDTSPDSSTSMRTESVFSLGRGIAGASDTPNGAGIRFLQASFFFFAVGAPLGCHTLLVALLLLPPKFSRWLTTPAEILYAWSAPDVLFVSMVAATLEMHLFVRFVIGDRCDGLNAVLRKFMNDELAGDDKCFDVVTSLKPGCFILGASSLLFFVSGFFIIRGATREIAGYSDEIAVGGDDGYDGRDDEKEERAWRQRRRDEQNDGTASTLSTSLSRSSMEEGRESQQHGVSLLLPLTQPLSPDDGHARVIERNRNHRRKENEESPRGMEKWFRGWGARHEGPIPRSMQGLGATDKYT